jgi:hypothetical protein
MLQEIRREILLQELTTVLHDEAIPAVTRNETVGKMFSYWCRQERIEQGTGKPLCAVGNPCCRGNPGVLSFSGLFNKRIMNEELGRVTLCLTFTILEYARPEKVDLTEAGQTNVRERVW